MTLVAGLAVATFVYVLAATLSTALRRPRAATRLNDASPPISLLKPLHGAEPNLYRNLRSFCTQRYPDYQILFGVQHPDDPAVKVAERLRDEFPLLDIQIVVDVRHYGINPKVNNLINLRQRARHPYLVISDSDIEVTPDYLANVTAPLQHADTGVVTCLYHAKANKGLWSRLGRLFVNDWFAPSVRLSLALGLQEYCAGASIAIRAEVLDRLGGFAAVKDQLADDFWIGKLCRSAGLTTVVCEQSVTTDVHLGSFVEMWHQEVRWMRTTRSLTPICFSFMFVTMTTPLALLLLFMTPSLMCHVIAATALFMRLVLHLRQNSFRPLDVALIPLRDSLLLAEWCVALLGGSVIWRGQKLQIEGGGSDKLSLPTP